MLQYHNNVLYMVYFTDLRVRIEYENENELFKHMAVACASLKIVLNGECDVARYSQFY